MKGKIKSNYRAGGGCGIFLVEMFPAVYNALEVMAGVGKDVKKVVLETQ